MDYVLVHHGVKGMHWGIRRYQRKDGSRTALGKRHQNQLNDSYDENGTSRKSSSIDKSPSGSNSTERKGLSDKQKKALKVGAAVVGTALAAYGTYKLASYVQDKRSQAAMQKAEDYIKNNILEKIGEARWDNGTVQYTFKNWNTGSEIVTRQASKSELKNITKTVGQQNAKTIATARQMYKDATSTKLDKGLEKIVNTGDAVGNTAKRAGTAVGNTAKKAKNSVLDVVNPLYEYVPGESRVEKIKIGDMDATKTITDYYKKRVKRR